VSDVSLTAACDLYHRSSVGVVRFVVVPSPS